MKRIQWESKSHVRGLYFRQATAVARNYWLRAGDPNRFLEIGGDGCGNLFLMDGSDATSNVVWEWVQDPPTGISICDGLLLSVYLSPQGWSLTPRRDPFGTTPTDGTIISRADHPERSILQPITMREWQSYVKSSPRLELDEDFNATNPFTNETVPMRRWPGRAKLKTESSNMYIEYSEVIPV